MRMVGEIFRKLLPCLAAVVLSGCVTTQYAAVESGAVNVANLQVRVADDLWNRAPPQMTVHLHRGSEMWTRDGPLLDRLILLSGIGNEQTLFKSKSESLVYPTFNRRMLPNEIAELNQASLAKLYGADVLVETTNLRPMTIGEQRSIMFDVSIASADQPTMSGRVAAFVYEDRLFEIIYLATRLHYFDKHWNAALKLMESARIVPTKGSGD